MTEYDLGEMKWSFLLGIDCINEIALSGQFPGSLVDQSLTKSIHQGQKKKRSPTIKIRKHNFNTVSEGSPFSSLIS